MGLAFFSPTAANTGGLVDIKFNSKDGAVYLSLIRQTGWDAQTKKGSFAGGAKINVKLSMDEAAGIIQAVRVGGQYKFYHQFNGAATTGSFRFYEIQPKQGAPNQDVKRGFGLSIKSGETEIKVGFTLGSAENLAEYLKFALNHCYSAIYSEDKEKAKEWAAKKEAESQPAPVPAAKAAAKPPVKSQKPKEPEPVAEPEPAAESQDGEDIEF